MAISKETNSKVAGVVAGGAAGLLGVEFAQTMAEDTAVYRSTWGPMDTPGISEAVTNIVLAFPFDSKALAVASAASALPLVYEHFRYRRPNLRVVDSLRNRSGASNDPKPTNRPVTNIKRAAKALGTLGAGYFGYRVGVDASHFTDAVLTAGTLSAGVTAAKIANKR